MSTRGLKLRVVFLWMSGVALAVGLLSALVWKQYAYVTLSRHLLKSGKEISALQNQVMVLETRIRSLRQRSRIEALAREHFGLVEGGVPILVQPEGQVLATQKEADTVKTASWRERFLW